MPRKTKPTAEPDPRQAKLDDWLDKHNARCAWSGKQPSGALVATWIVNGHVAVTIRYPRGGWDLFTGCPDSKIDVSLADAEERLGILPDSPGVTEDGRKGVVYWRYDHGTGTTEDMGYATLCREAEPLDDEAALFGGRWVSSSTAKRYADQHGHEFRST